MAKQYSQNIVLIIVVIAIIIIASLVTYIVYRPAPACVGNTQLCKNGQTCNLENLSSTFKTNLTDAQKKLSSDLLQVIGSGNTSENQLVYVYITTSDQVNPALINPYVWNITNTDPANHLLVAWINVHNLTALASLDTVQSIRSVTPPINS
jgi:hypothetical protein